MMDAFSNPLFQPQQTADGQIAPIIDARKLAEYVMREGFGVKNASQFIVPEPPPMLPPGMPPGMPGAEGMPPEGGPPQTPPAGEMAPPGPMPPVPPGVA